MINTLFCHFNRIFITSVLLVFYIYLHSNWEQINKSFTQTLSSFRRFFFRESLLFLNEILYFRSTRTSHISTWLTNKLWKWARQPIQQFTKKVNEQGAQCALCIFCEIGQWFPESMLSEKSILHCQIGIDFNTIEMTNVLIEHVFFCYKKQHFSRRLLSSTTYHGKKVHANTNRAFISS